MNHFYHSSDYAGLSAKNASFFYGYQETQNDEMCFVAEFSDQTITIPFSRLNAKDQFNAIDCLMMGIAYILSKYQIAI